MILTRDGKEITAIYKQDGTEIEEVKDANGRIVYSALREITGTSPLTFTSRVAGMLTDYRIYGDTVQDGTPSPDYPVDAVGCGERTENLNNGIVLNYAIMATDGRIVYNYESGTHKCFCMKIGKNEKYSAVKFGYAKYFWYAITLDPPSNRNETPLKYGNIDGEILSDTIGEYLWVFVGNAGVPPVTVVEGSIAPTSYIPYGYKLPVTVNGTDTVTTPVYIGTEPLHRIGKYADYVDYASGKIVRKIKKFVFDGTEGAWNIFLGVTAFRRQKPSGYKPSSKAFCTHFVNVVTGPRTLSDGTFGFDQDINFRNGHYSETSEAFNEYLAAQYAAGTPVTVWYVLAEPIEEDPPVPLPALPTLSGINTMSVDTTVKPSEVYIKGKIKPDGYGKLVDKNGVCIFDKNGVQLTVHGQGTSN